MKVVAKIALLWLVIGMVKANAQDDLTKLLEQETPKTTDYTSATFKGTRIINGHSVETVKKNHLDFLIHHRFDAGRPSSPPQRGR